MGVEHQTDDATRAEPGLKATQNGRPHPDSLEGAIERLEFTRRCREEDTRVLAVPIHKISFLDIRQDNKSQLIVEVKIDDELKVWKYDDLEAEIGDNADMYPPLSLDILQEKKKTFQGSQAVKSREHGKASASALHLVEMAHQGGRAEYFHDPNGILYGRIGRRGHFEVLAIRDGELAEWIEELCYDAEGLAPDEATTRRVISTLSVLARRGREYHVHLRHGEHDGAFYSEPMHR